MGILERFITEASIFTSERDVLRPSYLPEKILHRDPQLERLAGILSSALRASAPSNVIVYGKTGTGKTACAKFLQKEMEVIRRPVEVRFFHINCEITDTPYAVLQNLCAGVVEGSGPVPPSGLSLDRLYSMLVDHLNSKKMVVILALDEVDKLVHKHGDDVLYHLSRMNESLNRSSLSLISIANDLRFTEQMDARVLSSFSGEHILFPPYTARELKDILRDRAAIAFREGAVPAPMISLCATLAAQEHGDARRALDLLRVAGEIAERNGEETLREDHLYKAKTTIETDCINDAVRTLPHQSKFVLLSILLRCCGTLQTTTGDVYSMYVRLCTHAGLSPLTQRRIADLITDLDGLGLIQTSVRSLGRGGRTRFIQACIPFEETLNVLEEVDTIRALRVRKMFQARLF